MTRHVLWMLALVPLLVDAKIPALRRTKVLSITRAQPSRVVLQPGGPAALVKLTGDGFGRITGIRAVSLANRNQAARNVRISVVSRTQTETTVRIEALPGASPGAIGVELALGGVRGMSMIPGGLVGVAIGGQGSGGGAPGLAGSAGSGAAGSRGGDSNAGGNESNRANPFGSQGTGASKVDLGSYSGRSGSSVPVPGTGTTGSTGGLPGSGTAGSGGGKLGLGSVGSGRSTPSLLTPSSQGRPRSGSGASGVMAGGQWSGSSTFSDKQDSRGNTEVTSHETYVDENGGKMTVDTTHADGKTTQTVKYEAPDGTTQTETSTQGGDGSSDGDGSGSQADGGGSGKQDGGGSGSPPEGSDGAATASMATEPGGTGGRSANPFKPMPTQGKPGKGAPYTNPNPEGTSGNTFQTGRAGNIRQNPNTLVDPPRTGGGARTSGSAQNPKVIGVRPAIGNTGGRIDPRPDAGRTGAGTTPTSGPTGSAAPSGGTGGAAAPPRP